MRGLLACASALTLLLSANAHADCSTSIATGLDISGSVSHDELLMQVDGVVSALQSPAVISAIASQGCANFTVFVWGENHFVTLLPWIAVGSPDDAAKAEAMITAAASDYQVPPGQLTNIAGALTYAFQLFGQIPPTGRQILNVVTNGEQNLGGPNTDPLQVSLLMRQAGVTINGVAFGPSAELEKYLRENVSGGLGSFVMRIDGSADVAAAFRSKFILDLAQVQQ